MRRPVKPHFAIIFLMLVAAVATFAWLSVCDCVRLPASTANPLGGGGVDAAALGGEGEEVEIYIRNFRFQPAELRVKQGTRVVFINEDIVEHNILQGGGRRIGARPALFESPVLSGGQRWSTVLTDPGEYPIACTVDSHQLMGMVGTIIVESD